MAKEGMKGSMPIKGSDSGRACMYCGKSGCGCGSMMIISGIISIILAIWLWKQPEALPWVVAVILVLVGIKHIMIGFKWGK